jgi:hypothetical protein
MARSPVPATSAGRRNGDEFEFGLDLILDGLEQARATAEDPLKPAGRRKALHHAEIALLRDLYASR